MRELGRVQPSGGRQSTETSRYRRGEKLGASACMFVTRTRELIDAHEPDPECDSKSHHDYEKRRERKEGPADSAPWRAGPELLRVRRLRHTHGGGDVRRVINHLLDDGRGRRGRRGALWRNWREDAD